MARTKYEYQQTEVPTLRLVLSFNKLKSLDVVAEAFNILQTKGRRKAEFISRALENYEGREERNRIIQDAVFCLRNAARARELFSIKSEKAAKALLSISPDSEEFAEIVKDIPEDRKPEKMLCGFRLGRDEALHTRLFEMPVNDRVMLISNAVVMYVHEGLDESMNDILARKFVRDSILEYNSNEKDRKDILKNFMVLMNLSRNQN